MRKQLRSNYLSELRVQFGTAKSGWVAYDHRLGTTRGHIIDQSRAVSLLL